jgi:hypothetical protein
MRCTTPPSLGRVQAERLEAAEELLVDQHLRPIDGRANDGGLGGPERRRGVGDGQFPSEDPAAGGDVV